MTASYYPDATWLGNGADAGSYTSGPFKVVLHTTETETVPTYQGGKTAPHLTYDPRHRAWWQHTDLRSAARSLVNGPDPVQTNRDSALQVEIVCYSQKSITIDHPNRLWVGDLTYDELADIRTFLIWCHAEFGVEYVWPGRQALSYAEANTPGFRLTTTEWDNFNGVCGHQHVPDANVHWDPGALNWATLMAPLEENMDLNQHLDDHRWAGRLPIKARSWADDVWDRYVAAGGSTVPESRTRRTNREDLAWIWDKFIRPLEARVAALETTDNPTGTGLTFGQPYTVTFTDPGDTT